MAESLSGAMSVREVLERTRRQLHDLGVLSVRALVSQPHEVNGHVFFTLLDDEHGMYRLQAVLWRSRRASVARALEAAGLAGFGDGALVVVRGRLSVLERQGAVVFDVTSADVEAILGARALRRANAVRTLEAEGLLTRNRALPLPLVPLDVALVTSAAGVVQDDVRSELARSGFAFRTRLFHAAVTGADARRSLRAALARAIRAHPDVVILARGGGAADELAAFDDLELARLIATSPVCVWTAIGHAVDQPLVCFVAHRSFDVPHAAAHTLVELVTSFTTDLRTTVDGTERACRARLVATERASRDLRRSLATASRRRLDALSRERADLALISARAAARTNEQRAALQRAERVVRAAHALAAFSRATLPSELSLARSAVRQRAGASDAVAALGHALTRLVERDLRRRRTGVDDRSLVRSATAQLDHAASSLALVRSELRRAGHEALQRAWRSAHDLRRPLASIVEPLDAGFAILTDREGTWLRTALAVRRAGAVDAHLIDGDVALVATTRERTRGGAGDT